MPTIQISKIQLRRGPETDLPIVPWMMASSGSPRIPARLFIGQATPTDAHPNFDRATLPYQNIRSVDRKHPRQHPVTGVGRQSDGFPHLAAVDHRGHRPNVANQ